MSTIDELIRRNSKYYKPSEIVGNITKSEFGPNTRKLIHVMSRDGFKCDCCGESNVVFTLHKHSTKDRYKFRPYVLKGKRLVRMTLDHNVLDCLQGGNDKENMTALCEDCNALRQHKFAEYSDQSSLTLTTASLSTLRMPKIHTFLNQCHLLPCFLRTYSLH
ncbi:hypothetical protein [Salmonella phage SD-1_S14]|nr:hypothetical protein [Salmonella phage SD-1_S14]